MGELKDSKAKAGSAVNRSPDLTGDIDTLGAPAQDGLSKGGDKGEGLSSGIASAAYHSHSWISANFYC